MTMIFPGMDPYLEDPHIWPGAHSRLVVYLADYLQARLSSRYVASIEERVFVERPQRDVMPDVLFKQGRAGEEERGKAALLEVGVDADAPVLVRIPELEIHETYVSILDRRSGNRVVTVIEVVSPTNKFAGPGRVSYLTKQSEVLGSQASLVEIDLLRAGPHVLAVAEWAARGRGDYHYLVSINRARGLRDEYELYARNLRDRLPKIRIPLAEPDPDIPLDLQVVLAQTYEAGRYRDLLRYDAPCIPPLSPEDQAWAEAMKQQKCEEPQP